MKLRIKIEHAKDATGIKKRVIWSHLSTEIQGMESIDAQPAELEEVGIMGSEITKMVNFIAEQNEKKLTKDYTLDLQISKIKTDSPNVDRGMLAKLRLGKCEIESFFELNKKSLLDKEFIKLSANLLAAKTTELKAQRKEIIKNKKKNETKHISKKAR